MTTQVIQRTTQQRVVSVAIVGAIHVAAIAALLLALKPAWLPSPPPPTGPIQIVHVKQTPPRLVSVDTDVRITLVTPGTPSPVPVPRIDTDNPDLNPSLTPGRQGQNNPPQPSFSPATAIAATHSIPAYPPVAARLNEQGMVRLALSIDERGLVSDATVVGSSGYDTLDAAAVAWVKAHWRYEPAVRDGKPVSSTAQAVVTFRLLNRQG